MENNNLFKPASEKQINYLKSLGYEGDTDGLTSQECSTLIAQYSNKNTEQEEVKAQPIQKNEVVSPTINAVTEKNISDKVLNQVSNLVETQGLVLPQNYNVANALKSAYLKLSENNLLNTDKVSLAEALLNMCIQGLNPAKNQCYFINYGGKVNMMRSYFGDRTVAINTGLVKDVQANIIFKGDNVDVYYENDYLRVKHTTGWDNMSNEIIGAYAWATMPDGTKRYDIMTLDRIRKSWAMSKNKNDNKLQNQFTDDACKRTVIRHLVKMIFNETGDSDPVVESYNKTTADEYDNSRDYQNATIEEVKQEQEASGVKPINLEDDDI